MGTNVPYSLAVGDFNRDGNLDLAVVNYLPTGSVSILLGNGNGTFRAGAAYPVAVQPFFVATASLRRNGILDLVVSDSLSDDVYVMLGNGDGTFQDAVAYSATGRSYAVAVGAFMDDGVPDIAAITGSTDCECISVFPGLGNGTFQSAVTTPVPYNVDGLQFAAANFDSGEDLDLAVTGQFGTADQVDILLGNGDGTFSAHGYYPVSDSPYSVATGHFRSEETVDLAVGNFEGGSISVLLGDGNGTFQEAVSYDTYFPISIAIGDLNGEGKEDLVAANVGSPGNLFASTVSVLMGNGNGTFQPGISYPAGKRLNYVAIGDFNNDGKPDLVAVDLVGGSVITLLNTGVVSFSPTAPLVFKKQATGTTSAPQTVTLTNAGTTALKIASMKASAQFGMSSTCGSSVAPGANCAISVTFSPKTQGAKSGTVTINDSASSRPQVIELSGTGT
jgi:hypothetical protein